MTLKKQNMTVTTRQPMRARTVYYFVVVIETSAF